MRPVHRSKTRGFKCFWSAATPTATPAEAGGVPKTTGALMTICVAEAGLDGGPGGRLTIRKQS
jgi:hypothetical protein